MADAVTHHPHRSKTPGPRTQERAVAYLQRVLALREYEARAAAGLTPERLNATITAARSADWQNRLDRAERRRGGRGRLAFTHGQRLERYQRERKGRPLTVAQQRTLRRKAPHELRAALPGKHAMTLRQGLLQRARQLGLVRPAK